MYSEAGPSSKRERFGKIIMVFNYICKKLKGSEYASGFQYLRVMNIRKLSLTWSAITCSKLTIETLEQRCKICSKLTIKPPK